ncbi:MAG: hypothetical protein K0R78_3703 [Pelosinus sp.]|jgi:hypothetical protein|nr:hypothetical protein [Pelosinus sp.]
MSIKDLLILVKGSKYIIISAFIILSYNSISISLALGQKIDWVELGYMSMFVIATIWIALEAEKRLKNHIKQRNSLGN